MTRDAARAARLSGARGFRRGLAVRIAVAALIAAAVGLAILAAGVGLVGASVFRELMVLHGESAEMAQGVFDRSVMTVLLAGAALAAVASVVLAVVLARRLARPLDELGVAARRIAAGDYQARVPRRGPEEVADLADSFNQMAESLEEQERMRRDFIVNASHELRTPLTNLQGYLEALRDGVITADHETYVSLWEEADRLVRLARSLDELAEGDASVRAARPVDLDLVPVVSTALELARAAFEAKGITVERQLPARLPVHADPDHLAQVLANLLQNAARYAAPGGGVVVAAGSRPDSVLVSVANTGDPIPPSDLPHVFERFYRVEKSRDRARGGAGIGLAIVKQLVEGAGGRVGAESGRDGTRFWFSLPGGASGRNAT